MTTKEQILESLYDRVIEPSEAMEQLKSLNSGFKKIEDVEPPCLCPEHNPPMHIVLAPGKYEYTCPSCGKVTIVNVPLITY